MDIKELKERYSGKKIHLVGNAPLRVPVGAAIDSETVIRFNRGYQSSWISPLQFGRRTNILSIASSKRRRISKDDLDFLIDMEVIIWIDSVWPELDYFIPSYVRDDPRTYFHQRKDWEYLFAKLGNKKPSSGVMVFDLFHRIVGAKVSLFGFDWWKSRITTHHRPGENIYNPHDGEAERRYIKKSLGEEV